MNIRVDHFNGGGSTRGYDYSINLQIVRETAYARAWRFLEKGMAQPNSDFHVVRSQVALITRQHDLAIAEARSALEFSPNDAEALEAMAEALIYSGRPKEGIAFAQRTMRLNPTHLGRPLYLMGAAEFALGNSDKAVEQLERGREHAPNSTRLAGFLAAAYGELGLTEQAKAAFKVFRHNIAVGLHSLPFSVALYPFTQDGVLVRLAKGFRVAGAIVMDPIGPGYLPLHATNKLSGPEIKSLLFGSEIRGGRAPGWSGALWRQRRTPDGTVKHSGSPIHVGISGVSTGVGRIENDMLCELWPEFSETLELCVVIFRFPEGNRDYVMVTQSGPYTFDVGEPPGSDIEGPRGFRL